MNMKDSDLQFKNDVRERQRKFFWPLFLRAILIVPTIFLEILAPAIIDGMFGHVWGSVAAVANIIVWIYVGIKIKVTVATRVISWLIPFAFVVLIAVIEFAQLFHWKL